MTVFGTPSTRNGVTFLLNAAFNSGKRLASPFPIKGPAES
jgi:hypothetical protein